MKQKSSIPGKPLNPKILLCLALVLNWLFPALPARAKSVIIPVTPANIADSPLVVHATNADSGERFTVFYKTNQTTTDSFLHAQLELSDGAQTISSVPVEKRWTTNGVEFEFTVSAAYLSRSKFSIFEPGHVREMPMPGFVNHWFYLRSFASPPPGGRDPDHDLTRRISAALTECQKIKPGMTRAELLKEFITEGGLSTAAHRTYVYRDCPYIKVDVDFTPSDHNQKPVEEQLTDVISKISPPYLQWSISD